MNNKVYPVTLILIILLVFGFLYALSLGSVEISYSAIVNIVSSRLGFTELTASRTETVIIERIRLPRNIMALLVGATLATAGISMQGLFQNPLVSPYLLGISASASLGSVLAFTLGFSPSYYGLFAFILSMITAAIIYYFSKVNQRSSVTLLILLGIGLGALYSAISSFLIYYIGEDSFQVIVWLMGYLGDATWERIIYATPPIVMGIIILNCFGAELNIFMSGEEEAKYLGVNVERTKKIILGISTFIVSISVAYGGLISFVGLVIPHILRILVGNNHKILLPLSTLAGALFLLTADTVARTVISPVEIPIGVITSFIGGPFFIYLIIRRRAKIR
ncbi:iron ABC transporter permease [Halanaerobiaceae bacterium Z-7014]|uniref:Iron ABC transporter permease n=1 Tax=Halonatronomonas betaini TaxID=2778430 RepID=A0A931F9Q9_9FIRM|nr:iron ABC transporter permease [Halonatronomonas betaini]MBF8436167.1 iron ABC transporter permease [Halonatronomonas betaini]